jgi:hypothetical protein
MPIEVSLRAGKPQQRMLFVSEQLRLSCSQVHRIAQTKTPKTIPKSRNDPIKKA